MNSLVAKLFINPESSKKESRQASNATSKPKASCSAVQLATL